MYCIQALLLTRDDLWSKGAIQRLYLNETEMVSCFCLGMIINGSWEPMRVHGKVAYAYLSETYAQAICAKQACPPSTTLGELRKREEVLKEPRNQAERKLKNGSGQAYLNKLITDKRRSRVGQALPKGLSSPPQEMGNRANFFLNGALAAVLSRSRGR